MSSRQYPLQDTKILYGKAAGRCSFPDCRIELILPETASDSVKQIGKIAHIVAHSNNGPRGDPRYSLDKLDTYDNWILLCPTCHDKVDVQSNSFTVSDLRQIKADHELWVRTLLVYEMPQIGFAELEIVAKGISGSPIAPSEDFSLLPPREKMKKNRLTDDVLFLLTIGLSKSSEVRTYVQNISRFDPNFPERLKAGFVKEYERLRANELQGDALFESLRDFSAGGSTDFKRQAAGLAILVYLFELCEIFEK
jgi:hypothetical protein